jgi:hypothetical protein
MAPSDALLYPIAGRVDYDERRAIYWVPNRRTEKEFVGLPHDVNSRRVRKLHRIAVCSDYADIELAFAIRHELEHARQIEFYGRELGELHGLIEDMLRGESTALYNAMPMERDANGAAAQFVQAIFPAEDVRDHISAGSVLGEEFWTYDAPLAVENLRSRTAEYLVDQYPRCIGWAGDALTFRARLRRAWPDFVDDWQTRAKERGYSEV